jgi:hypothetical protein
MKQRRNGKYLQSSSLRGSVLEIGFSSNKCIYVGIGAILILQFGFVYLLSMNALFGSAPLGLAACHETQSSAAG